MDTLLKPDMTKSVLEVNEYGDLIWRNEKGQVHRDNDKPAVISTSGAKQWFINGKRHRGSNKPAIVYPDGYKEWWKNDIKFTDSFKLI